MKSLPKVTGSEEIQYNWNSWNDIQNTFNLHVINPELSYPKHLVIQAWKWFLEQAKERHIDPSFYKYCTVTKWDYSYQVDFYCDENCVGSCFGFYEIYYDSKNKKILQATFAIGG